MMNVISNNKVPNTQASPNSAGAQGDLEATAILLSKFCRIVDKVDGSPGNQAWSEPVPASRVFAKLREDLAIPGATVAKASPTVEDISIALDNMFRPHQHSSPLQEIGGNDNSAAPVAVPTAAHLNDDTANHTAL